MPYVTRDGVRTYYEVDGSGPPLVLFIGFLGSLEDWRRDDTRYTAGLRDAYRLILLDPRGQGRSDAPPDPDAYTLAARAGDVLSVLDELDIARSHFWGYSMGGSVGLTLAAHTPDRLLSLIAGGTNPYHQLDDPTDHDLYRWLGGGMDGFVEEWERVLGPIPAGVRERWLAQDAEVLRASWIALQRPHGLVDALPGLHVPVLLYVGTEDDPDPVRRAAGVLPDATFVELEGLNHPQAFRRSDLMLPHVRRFLERVNQALTTDVDV